MRYIRAWVVLAMLTGVAGANVIDLGGGQYMAVIQSGSSQTKPHLELSNNSL